MSLLDDTINLIDNTKYASEYNKSGVCSKSLLDCIAGEAKKRGINPAIPQVMSLVSTRDNPVYGKKILEYTKLFK